MDIACEKCLFHGYPLYIEPTEQDDMGCKDGHTEGSESTCSVAFSCKRAWARPFQIYNGTRCKFLIYVATW